MTCVICKGTTTVERNDQLETCYNCNGLGTIGKPVAEEDVYGNDCKGGQCS